MSYNGWVKPPLCPFCSAPWTDSMLQVEANSSQGCETCGWGGGSYGTVKITCESCNRLVFQKDFDERG